MGIRASSKVYVATNKKDLYIYVWCWIIREINKPSEGGMLLVMKTFINKYLDILDLDIQAVIRILQLLWILLQAPPFDTP